MGRPLAHGEGICVIVVSYATEDGVYDEYLQRLKESCVSHGLAHDMEVTAAAPRKSAVLEKPKFIRRMLRKHNDVVLWLDADAVVSKAFTLPRSGWDIGLARNTKWRERRKNPTSAFAISVRPTDAAETFLDTWEYLCSYADMCRHGDHRRLTWTREMRSGEYSELRLEQHIPGCVIRDFGRKKQGFLR